jgi:crotonobetainyl-CoA:carnitine CoA-transferase CaiB-like acyl-CoA transferase
LSGVKVLDLTTVVMGPFATQILAELGADVIEVEPHEGDNMRDVGPMKSRGMGHLYLHLNRGKRCLVLDLKQPQGREALMRLIPDTDVLVYNVRPQAMARLGLSYDDVRAANPRIIYVGAYGYSQRGPYAAKAAYDDLIQGASGLPALNSEKGTQPPRYAPINLADRVTGLHAVYAVTTALFHRERTGRGQAVEVPMFESLAQFVLGDHLAGCGEPPIGPTGYPRLEHRRPYATKDGYLCVLVYNNKQWKAFLEAVGRPELMADSRFSTPAKRAEHIGEIYEFLAGLMRGRTSAGWSALLEAADIPVSPINSVEDVVSDPHLTASGFFAGRARQRRPALNAYAHGLSISPEALRPAPPGRALGGGAARASYSTARSRAGAAG